MKSYLAPVNPLHENPYTTEDLWWLDNAWSQEVADEIYAASQGNDEREQAAVEALLERVEGFLPSNLPEMVPSGEFITGLLLRMESIIPDKEKFFEAEDEGVNAPLSRPLRLYRHLVGVRGSVNDWAHLPDKQVRLSNILLATTEFTDADLQWLLLDGGRDRGMTSLGDLLEGPLASTAWKTGHYLAASVRQHGGLPVRQLKYFLSNHSAATTETYADLVDFIGTELDNPAMPAGGLTEDYEALRAVVQNPVTPTAVLESVVEHLKPELAWMSVADSFQRGSLAGSKTGVNAFQVVTEASDAASRRSRTGPTLRGDLDWWVTFASLVVWHPNWARGATPNLVDPDRYIEVMLDSKSGLPIGMLPTTKANLGASANVMMNFMGQLPPSHPVVQRRLILQSTAFQHLAFSDLKADLAKTHVKDLADAVIAQKLKEQEISIKNLINVSFGLGKFLKAWTETRDAFAEVGGSIPDEWLRELAF